MIIDWSKAPEGATHFAPSGKGVSARWFDMDNGRVFHNNKWEGINYWAGREDLIPRPKPEAWTGEGLPPVGVVCEVHDNDPHQHYKKHVGQQVEILAHTTSAEGGKVAVYKVDIRDSSEYHGLVAQCFRPIKTAEQIAAEEREKTIAELKKVFDSISHELCQTSNKYLETLFGAIHDAGWKQVKP